MAIFLFIFVVLLAGYLWLIDYYRRAWNQIPEFVPDRQENAPFVTVVIPARNEEHNLARLVDSLNFQTYPESSFEVIIVDDHSTDNTWEILQGLASQVRYIRPVRVADVALRDRDIIAHKKFAIETAISMAQGQLIVTTDADCVFQPDWLTYLAAYYSDTGAKFIAAPVKLRAHNTFLSIFQALDFLTLQGITGASVFKRLHTMCNGANLAYEKDAFIEVGGFSGIDKIPSGDDMLLMHKIYKKYPDKVFYLRSRQAIVTTDAAMSWKAFIHQRIRWASKASHYDDKKVFRILLLVYCVNLCFVVLTVASLWKATWLVFLILLLIAKVLVEFPFVNSVSIFFSESRLMKYFPLMQPIHILYTVISGWLGKFGSYEWKGRHINQKHPGR